jgi:hypothetical protein
MSSNLKITIILVKFFLLVLPPILLIYILNINAVLPIIAYLQFLLIWTQAEIGLKQHILFSAQFDPSFKISSKFITSLETSRDCLSLEIKNTSKNPAYTITLARFLDHNNNPIMSKIWKEKISDNRPFDLSPDEQSYLCQIIDLEFIQKNHLVIGYHNQFGDYKEFQFYLSKFTSVTVPSPINEPGILMNTFREITLLPFIIKMRLKVY